MSTQVTILRPWTSEVPHQIIGNGVIILWSDRSGRTLWANTRAIYVHCKTQGVGELRTTSSRWTKLVDVRNVRDGALPTIRTRFNRRIRNFTLLAINT